MKQLGDSARQYPPRREALHKQSCSPQQQGNIFLLSKRSTLHFLTLCFFVLAAGNLTTRLLPNFIKYVGPHSSYPFSYLLLHLTSTIGDSLLCYVVYTR